VSCKKKWLKWVSWPLQWVLKVYIKSIKDNGD
jgi:hypothetical protein